MRDPKIADLAILGPPADATRKTLSTKDRQQGVLYFSLVKVHPVEREVYVYFKKVQYSLQSTLCSLHGFQFYEVKLETEGKH